MFLLAVVIGAFVGWIASVVVRADTNEAILIDILVGAAGGLILPLLLAGDALLDTVLAGGLGALLALFLLFGIQRAARRAP